MGHIWQLQVQRQSSIACIIDSMASKVNDLNLQSPELLYQFKYPAVKNAKRRFPISAIVDKTAEGSESTFMGFLSQPPTNDRYPAPVAAGSDAHSCEIYVSLMEAAQS